MNCTSKAGEKREIKRSECDQMVSCQAGKNAWFFMKRDECIQYQQKLADQDKWFINTLVDQTVAEIKRINEYYNEQARQSDDEFMQKVKEWESQARQAGMSQEEIDQLKRQYNIP